MKPTGVNADQIRYWNEVAGPKWVTLQHVIDGQIRPLGELAMDRAGIVPGERVIDVGCGCGLTTVAIGRRVGSEGEVLGLDVSRTMLESARRHADAKGMDNVRFEAADAQTFEPDPGGFDLLFSRFGVMFFDDPAAAFRNLRAALRPGGRLAFVCWQALPKNPWMLLAMTAAAAHLKPTPPPADAPGPFSFADPDRVRGILESAGFTDVALESHLRTLTVGGEGPLEAAVDFLLQMGPTGAALREANDPALLERVQSSVIEMLRPYWSEDGGLRLGSASWIVTARQTSR